MQDRSQVVVKMVAPADDDREGQEELEILQRFSSEPLKSDPRNHVVPCLDTFPIPGVEGGVFYVMPLLSKYKDPAFYNLNEIKDFLGQIFEVRVTALISSIEAHLFFSLQGLEFLHLNDVVHWYAFHPDIFLGAV